MRISMWRMRQPKRKGDRMTISLASTKEFEEKIASTNLNEVFVALLVAPALVEKGESKELVVGELVKLMKANQSGIKVAEDAFGEDRYIFLAEKASDALAKIGEPSIDALREVWNYGGMRQRLLAGKAISQISSRSLISIQKKIIATPGFPSGMRRAAIFSLAELKDPAFINIFFNFSLAAYIKIQKASVLDSTVDLGDPRKMRNMALQAIEDYGVQALDYLLEQLDSEHKQAQIQAAHLLAKLDDPRAVTAREEMNVSDGSKLQAAVIRALDELHKPSSLPIIANYLNSQSSRIYLQASDVLVNWGPPAFPHVLKEMGRGNQQERQRKTATMRRLTGQKFGMDRTEWRTWVRQSGYLDNVESSP